MHRRWSKLFGHSYATAEVCCRILLSSDFLMTAVTTVYLMLTVPPLFMHPGRFSATSGGYLSDFLFNYPRLFIHLMTNSHPDRVPVSILFGYPSHLNATSEVRYPLIRLPHLLIYLKTCSYRDFTNGLLFIYPCHLNATWEVCSFNFLIRYLCLSVYFAINSYLANILLFNYPSHSNAT